MLLLDMDPNLFHLDWERTLEAIVGIIVLSFLVERVGAVVFESRWFAHNTKVPASDSKEGVREKNGVATALGVVDAGGDAAKMAKAVKTIEPDSPLWPLPPGDPGEMVARSEEHLKTVRRRQERRQKLSRMPIKELGALSLGAGICLALDFDAPAIIMLSDSTTWWGAVITGAVVAGGSKASIRLFRDLLDIKSEAVREMKKPDGKDG